MNKSLKLFVIVTSATAIGFFASFSLSQIQLNKLALSNVLTSSGNDQKDFFNEIVKKVKEDYVEEKSNKELYESAANGMLKSLDPHSSYLSKEDFKEMQVQTKGEFGGLGIEITMEHQLVKIISAIDSTPADRAGIKSGDYISKIDGKTVVGLNIQDVVKKLRGKPNTSVNITIIRKNSKKPIEKTVQRDIIKVKAVKSSVFNDVGYIKINTFSQQADIGVERSLRKIKNEVGEENLRGIVLDLRNNPGGLLDRAVKVSDLFLDKDQVIVSIRGRKKSDEIIYKDDNEQEFLKNKPIVVLVNAGSASASEIVAGALQDNKRAVIMGEKSFGKGSVQTVIPLNKNDSALRLTTALYYTPSGKSIQARGIDPDIIVEEAKIKKSDTISLRSSEAELEGHIEAQIKEEIKNSKQIKDSNFGLYEDDYQLARAIDLIRGLSVFGKISK